MNKTLPILLLVLGTGASGCAEHPFDSTAYTTLTYEHGFAWSDCAPVGEARRIDLTRDGAQFAMTGVVVEGIEADCEGNDCVIDGEPIERQLVEADLASVHLALDEATLKPDDTECTLEMSCSSKTITVDGERFSTGCGTDKLEGADMRRIADELEALLVAAPTP